MEQHRPESCRDAALRRLRRRPRTRAELAQELQRLGHGAAEIESTLLTLEDSGYLNDVDLARHYITVRAARLGHGRERLFAELEQRGVPRGEIARAWQEAVESGEIEPREQLRAAVRRRVRELASLDSRGYARVYNALLRAGFDAEEIRCELDPYRAGDPFDTPHHDETHHDLP